MQTQKIEREVTGCLWAAIAVPILGLMLILACTKSEPVNEMTGVWARDNGVIYSFFDDSRFQQSDKAGQQWIWEKKGTRIFFYGNPERVWTVDFQGVNDVTVIETDTFKINRK